MPGSARRAAVIAAACGGLEARTASRGEGGEEGVEWRGGRAGEVEGGAEHVGGELLRSGSR